MDYILYTDEATNVKMYDRSGHLDKSLKFNAKTYLNRIARQYKKYSQCDARKDNCIADNGSPFKLMFGWDKGLDDTDAIYAQKHLTCANVPHPPETWWSHFMAYPTFTALIVPYDDMTRSENADWIHTFMRICNFFRNNSVEGAICATTYFEVSQELIATMLVAGKFLKPLPPNSSSELGNQTSAKPGNESHEASSGDDNVTEGENASAPETDDASTSEADNASVLVAQD